MKKILALLLTLVFLYIVFIFGIENFNINDRNFTIVPIAVNFLALLGVFQLDKTKFSESLSIRLVFFILILVNTILFALGAFINTSSIINYQYLVVTLIMILIMFVIAHRFFINQISLDLFWLQKKVNFRRRWHKNNLSKVDESINNIDKYILQNLSSSERFSEFNEFKVIIDSICNELIHGDFKDKDNLALRVSLYEKIFDVYYNLYKKSENFGDYRVGVLSTIANSLEYFYSRKYLDYFKITNNVYKKIIKYELKNKSLDDRSLETKQASISYLSKIQDIYENNHPCNNEIDETVKSIAILMRMFDFHLDEKDVINIILELVETFIVTNVNKISELDVEFLKVLIHLLHNECIPRKLHLFYNSMIMRIPEGFESCDNSQVLNEIINTIYYNEYDKTPLVMIIKDYAEKIKFESDISKTSIFFDFLSKLDTSQLHMLPLKSFFEYYIHLDISKKKDFAFRTFRKLLTNNEKSKFVLSEVRRYNNDFSCDQIVEILSMIFPLMRDRQQNSYYWIVILIYGEVIERTLKEGVKDSSGIIQRLVSIINSLDYFGKMSDSDQVINSIVDLLSEYLDNPHAKVEFFSKIMEIGYISIEQGRSTIYSNVSNRIGWYIYEQIGRKAMNERENCDVKWIVDCFEKLVNFYSEVCYYRKSDALFVGTAIVVNLTYVHKLKSEYEGIKPLIFAFYSNLRNLLSAPYDELSDQHKENLFDSARIRKYSIHSYIDGDAEGNKKLLNNIFTIK